MKKIILLYFFLILFFYSSAQVPGYLGKKFSIGYETHLSPPGEKLLDFSGYLDGSNSPKDINYNGKESSIFLPQMKHSLIVEYTLSNRLSLHAGVQSYRFAEAQYYGNNPSYPLDSFFRDKASAIRFGFSISKPNYIAPQGRYFAMDFQLINNEIIYYNKRVETIIGDGSSIGVTMNWGNRRVLFDRLIFDYALGTGFTFGGQTNITEEKFKESNLEELHTYEFLFNLFHLKLGLKYLVF